MSTKASLVLCPCAYTDDTQGAIDALHCRSARRRPDPMGKYWDYWCILCGPLVYPRSDRRIPTEVAAAYRIGGLGAVKALVGDWPSEYPALRQRLVKSRSTAA